MSDFCKRSTALYAEEILKVNTDEQYAKEMEEYQTKMPFTSWASAIYDISLTDTFNDKSIYEARQIFATMSDEDWKHVYKEIKQYYIENYEDGEKLYHEIYGKKEEEP